MALRNHDLDQRILDSARAEFVEKGYRGASLRKIAEGAGATLGAIRTRHKTKDDLFCAVLGPFLQKIEAAFEQLKGEYAQISPEELPDALQVAMRDEAHAILDLAFGNYEDARLLLGGSEGSTLEGFCDQLAARKTSESMAFFSYQGAAPVDGELLALLVSFQFDSYRALVLRGYAQDVAKGYMDELLTYHLAGWSALFDEGFGDAS